MELSKKLFVPDGEGGSLLPIPELQTNKSSRKMWEGANFLSGIYKKKSFQKNRGEGMGSLLSGQVPDRNGKSILMASLSCSVYFIVENI